MINVLKKGLKFLKSASHRAKNNSRQISRQEILFLHWQRMKLDEQWLDGAGNMIDEERVAEVLDNESGYAKSTIEKYVAALDEPYARNLESILADFARSTRLIEAKKLKVLVLTDYFACK